VRPTLPRQHPARLVARLLVAATVATTILSAGGAASAAPSRASDDGPSLADAVPAVSQFVARARGLAFGRPVAVRALAGPDFDRLLLAGSSRPRPPRDTGATYQGLHLVPSARRYDDREARVVAAGVVGFYQPGRDTLVVRAAGATPFARAVLAHELTHALQDQHFDLPAVMRRGTDADAAAAVAALYEGDAVRVEEAYVASMSAADQRDYSRAVAGYRLAPDPEERVLGAFVGFPYAYGPGLVRALLAAGGQRRLDAAFADPPRSTEQVVDPRRYLRAGRDRPRAVPHPRPPAGARVVDSGVLGAYGLAVVLAARVPDVATRSRAALGWGGDGFVTWPTSRGYCTRIRVLTDTGRDRAELLGALRRWSQGYPRSGTAVVPDARDVRALTLTSCA